MGLGSRGLEWNHIRKLAIRSTRALQNAEEGMDDGKARFLVIVTDILRTRIDRQVNMRSRLKQIT